jgi:hypothetical protein
MPDALPLTRRISVAGTYAGLLTRRPRAVWLPIPNERQNGYGSVSSYPTAVLASASFYTH